ncbi:uncharacterized protein LOC105763852 [Gossypium raimondii]|uniref:uncharacterized protein LOC105763852 n=1 Tax=Gossypium raimondii TaxID=29730 RepID=UPI00063AEAC3|nr:uncharacterized protein LOC105763852 [Gossypium raimondii]
MSARGTYGRGIRGYDESCRGTRADSSSLGSMKNLDMSETPATLSVETGSQSHLAGDDALSQAMLRVLERVSRPHSGSRGRGSVNRLYRKVPLEVQGVVFSANLMELPFREFDLILVNEKLVRKGCEVYLAYVSVSVSRDSSIENIRIVREFLDVFPNELLSLPLNREVEFDIELLPSTAPVSIAPYRMALKELIELMVLLQELLDRGFIHPSVSPWGAPVFL